MVPRGLLKEWATHTFPNATDYWAFRKNVSGIVVYFSTPFSIFYVHCDFYYHELLLQLTIQLAQCGFAEFVLHLTRMNPDMMYLHQDSGFLNISYFKFDIDDTTGKTTIKLERF